MKISILMAVGENASRMGEALAGIRAQTHPDWELLVVEYGAASEARGLVQAFGALTGRPVTHLHLGENHGPASARNRLLELATGEWVAFLEPCDQWTPSHLTNAALQLVAAVDIVVSDVLIENPPLPLSALAPSPQLDVNAARTLFVRDALPVISALALRRALAVEAGFFDTQFRVGEARDLWLRCALRGAHFGRTRHATCRTVRVNDPDPREAFLSVDQRIRFYEKHRDLAVIPAALRRHLLSASLVAKGRLLRGSDPLAAARCFGRAWTLQPMHIQTLGQLALIGSRSNTPVSPAKKPSSSI